MEKMRSDLDRYIEKAKEARVFRPRLYRTHEGTSVQVSYQETDSTWSVTVGHHGSNDYKCCIIPNTIMEELVRYLTYIYAQKSDEQFELEQAGYDPDTEYEARKIEEGIEKEVTS